MHSHNTGVVSSNSTPVTIKTPLVRKATENHLMKSIPKIDSQPCLWFLLTAKWSMLWRYSLSLHQDQSKSDKKIHFPHSQNEVLTFLPEIICLCVCCYLCVFPIATGLRSREAREFLFLPSASQTIVAQNQLSVHRFPPGFIMSWATYQHIL